MQPIWNTGLDANLNSPLGRIESPTTGETLFAYAPVWYKQDFFIGGTTATAETILPFAVLDTSAAGNTTPLFATSAPGGALVCPLDNTDETQLSGFYHGDQLLLNINKRLNIEARIMITSASMVGISFYFGLANAHNATFTSVDTYLCAKLSGDFALATTSRNAAGTPADNTALATLVTATQYVMRWDLTNPAIPRFFLNGTEQTLSTAHDLSGLTTATTARVQPYLRVGKASGTTLALVQVDYVSWWSDR